MKKYIDFNLLSDWKRKLLYLYDKQIGYELDFDDVVNVDNKDLWEHFLFPEYTFVEEDTDEKGNLMVEDVKKTSVIVNEDIMKPDKELFNVFFNENLIDIIGHAPQIKTRVIKLNQLQNDDIKPIVYSTFKGRGRSAVLLFLGAQLHCNDVVFIDDINELNDGEIIDTEEKIKKLLKEDE